MKKIMLGLAVAGVLAFTSTGVNAQKKATTATTATTATVATTTAKEQITIPEPPKFASEDVNKSIGEFVKLIREYAPAIKSSDAAALAEFGPKMQAWEQGASSWATTMGPEDQSKLQNYMQQVGAVLQPASPVSPAEHPSPVQQAAPIAPAN